jgi:hypothetical protein
MVVMRGVRSWRRRRPLRRPLAPRPVRRRVIRRRWGCLPGCVLPLVGLALILGAVLAGPVWSDE